MLQIKNYKEADPSQYLAMFGSEAHGLPLVKHDFFAADMLHFLPNQKTEKHTHPGDHILFVVDGFGWLIFDNQRFELLKGACYFVPGEIPHQVGALESELFLLSVANNHRPVNSAERVEVCNA